MAARGIMQRAHNMLWVLTAVFAVAVVAGVFFA